MPLFHEHAAVWSSLLLRRRRTVASLSAAAMRHGVPTQPASAVPPFEHAHAHCGCCPPSHVFPLQKLNATDLLGNQALLTDVSCWWPACPGLA